MSMRKDAAALAVRYVRDDPDQPYTGEGIPLAVPSYGPTEVAEAIQVLLSGQLSMGARVLAFEHEWAHYVGVEHAIMVNSGSSALLVMLSALVETGRLRRGDELIVPAVGWSTSLFSVAQAGLRPVVVDVDADTLCVRGRWDRPVLAVHLMGQPARVQAPLVLEDACGAHGARIGATKVGGVGLAGAFSFFFSHHITTGEGGMITTSDGALADACRSIRAHGWIRERADRRAWEQRQPQADPRFLFISPGYNVRPTEVAGAFGVHQVRRLDRFVQRRNRNHQEWCEGVVQAGLPVQVFPQAEGTHHAAFGFPMVLRPDAPVDRATLCARLEAEGIQTRPISGGNLARQPAFERVPGARVQGPLPVADGVFERGLFVGQSHAFGAPQGRLLVDALTRALR